MKQLPDSELAIMDLLWHDETLTARQIREALYPDPSKAQHGTVQRLLQRLEDKGYIERDRTQSVHLFRTTLPRQTYAGQRLESLASRLTAGSIAPLITHLVDQNKISSEDIDRIKAILDEHSSAGGEHD